MEPGNKFGMQKKYLILALLGFSISLLFLSFISVNEKVYVISIVTVWLLFLIYSIFDIYNRIMLLMFLIAFYNFLIGRSLLITTGMYKEVYSFTSVESIKGQAIVLFSLVCFGISYVAIDSIGSFNKKKRDKNQSTIILEKNKIERIRAISKSIYLILYPFLLISTWIVIRYVLKHGYASIYQVNTVKVPFFIKKLGDLSIVFFWIYLGSMPTKKDLRLPVMLWIIYLLMTLGVGARFDFVVGTMMTFTYLFIRNKVSSTTLWIKKRDLIIISIVSVFSLVGLSIYNDARFSYKPEVESSLQYVTKFFYDQGININNNKRIFKYSDQINAEKYYSFKNTKFFIDRNINHRLLKNPYFKGNSVEKATQSNSLDDTLSLLVLGEEKYLSGHGVGSSYIAEVFLDFSWVGLIMVNFMYAFILHKMNKTIMGTENISPYFVALVFLVFGSFLRVPRSNADAMIIQILNPVFWFATIVTETCLKLELYFKTNK